MGVSKNRGTPKSSILIGFSTIIHLFWGYPYFWKHTHVFLFGPSFLPLQVDNLNFDELVLKTKSFAWQRCVDAVDVYSIYIYKLCFSKTVPHQDWNRLLLVYAVYGLRALEALKRKSSYIVSWQRQWDNDWSTKDPVNLSSLETKSLEGHLGAKGGLQDHRSNERERESDPTS